MTKKLLLTVLLSIVSLSGCGLDIDGDRSNSKEIEDQNRLLKTYRVIEGNYEGTVTPQTEGELPYPVRITINIAMVPGSINENNQERSRPVLRAYYQRLDFEENSQIGNYYLDVAYFQTTGRITLTSSTSQPLPRTPGVGFISIIAAFSSNGVISGEQADHIGNKSQVYLERVE
jgi:hypothetical protein